MVPSCHYYLICIIWLSAGYLYENKTFQGRLIPEVNNYDFHFLGLITRAQANPMNLALRVSHKKTVHLT